MRIHEVWYTCFDDEYNDDLFLYHYTDITKAFKILCNATLKFSKISGTNDTLESKPRIIENEISSNLKEFKTLSREYVQLLCFSTDIKKAHVPKIKNITDDKLYSDYTGRGFSLPRMWAQYAQNSSGLCLVFDLKKLRELIRKQLGKKALQA